MKSLVCLLLVYLFAGPVAAAEIQLHKGQDGFDVISINGDILIGDEVSFNKLALQSSNALVIMQSNGGHLAPALEIGRTIQIRGYSTYVPKDMTCTSSCALIWVAGQSKYLSATSKIGFHASYRNQEGRREEVGVANAIIGRYLTLLNLPERAIVFATMASPDEILWIDPISSNTTGIAYEIFELENGNDGQDTQGSPGPDLTYSVSDEEIASRAYHDSVDWYYSGVSQSGSVIYVRGEDVRNGRANSNAARVWVMTDDIANSELSRRSSKTLYSINCLAETYAINSITDYSPSGVSKTFDGSSSHSYIVPGSVFENVSQLVCADKLPVPDERDIRR